MEKEKIVIPKDVKELVEQREETRKAKDWKLADELRKKISEKGFMVEDKKEGYKLSKR